MREFFPQAKQHIYFDHAANTIPPRTVLEEYFQHISTNLYGNTHSNSTCGLKTQEMILSIKKRLLNYINDFEYEIAFTKNATDSLKYLVYNMDWKDRTIYVHWDNHTSIFGMRQVIENKGGRFISATPEKWNSLLNDDNTSKSIKEMKKAPIFAFLAQSNFSGKRYPVEAWSEKIHRIGGLILLDPSSILMTFQLDFSLSKPDFFILSFYKIFGYPTNLGALFIRSTRKVLIEKEYFGGGSVKSIIYDDPWVILNNQLEDGKYLNICLFSYNL